MAQSSASETQSRLGIASAGEQSGCYVYCVVRAGEGVSLGAIGIAGREVYTVAYKDLCTLVHGCPSQPYQSDDAEVAAAWVLAHHRVVDAAWQRWGTVLPLTFNTIIVAGEKSAEGNLRAWLEAEYESLKGRLDAFTGKAEYGVQVFWDPSIVARRTAESSPDIKKLEEEMQTKSRGLAYMYRQKLEAMLRKEMETRAAKESRELYGRLSRCVANIHVEKVKKAEAGRQMLMNLSCLVSAENRRDLEMELERISGMEGFSARLVGPLPPYSFC